MSSTLYAFLDSDDCVVYLTTEAISPQVVAARGGSGSTAVGRIDDVPGHLLIKGRHQAYHRYNGGDGTTDAAWEQVVDIPRYRTRRITEVNRKTAQLFDAGFVYNNATYSLSVVAQNSINAAYAVRDALTYPVNWPTKDDAAVVQIADATEMANFCEAAFAAVIALRSSGVSLKSTLVAKTNVAEVDAVTDDR